MSDAMERRLLRYQAERDRLEEQLRTLDFEDDPQQYLALLDNKFYLDDRIEAILEVFAL